MLNDGKIMGRMTGDPVLKYGMVDGKPYAQFAIACERDYRAHGKSYYDFPSFIAYGRMGEICHQYLRKGQSVIVEYQLKTVSHVVDGRKLTQTRPTVVKVRFARLSEPLAEVPDGGDPDNIEFLCEGFDEEGLIERTQLKNADS